MPPLVRKRKAERLGHYTRPSYLTLVARLRANLRRMRTERNWTLEDAAGALGTSYQALQSIESGKTNITLTTVARLCDAFKVDVIVLFAPIYPKGDDAPKG